jgi:hypothetical protein
MWPRTVEEVEAKRKYPKRVVSWEAFRGLTDPGYQQLSAQSGLENGGAVVGMEVEGF